MLKKLRNKWARISKIFKAYNKISCPNLRSIYPRHLKHSLHLNHNRNISIDLDICVNQMLNHLNLNLKLPQTSHPLKNFNIMEKVNQFKRKIMRLSKCNFQFVLVILLSNKTKPFYNTNYTE